MLSRICKKRVKGEGGFTLIELLVVIIIIAILAAIAIPMYLSQRKKGWHANVQSDLRNAAVAQESYFTDNSAYADTVGAATGALKLQGFNKSANITFTNITGTTTSYTMTAHHDNDAACEYTMTNASGEPVAGAGC